MKRMLWLATGVLLSGLLTGQGMANETAGKPACPTPQAGTGEPVSAVSQIQQDIVNKRELARQRKNAMLQVRDQTITDEAKMTEEEKSKLKVGAAAK